MDNFVHFYDQAYYKQKFGLIWDAEFYSILKEIESQIDITKFGKYSNLKKLCKKATKEPGCLDVLSSVPRNIFRKVSKK